MLIPITGPIKFIEAPDKARFPYSHGLLVDDEIKTIIDTGFGEENRRQLSKKNIHMIINSHFHEDHMALNTAFPGVPVWASPEDAPGIRSVQHYRAWYGFEYFQASHIGDKFIAYVNWKEAPVDRELTAGQHFQTGQTSFVAIPTPGHTHGHYAFWFPQERIMYTGDIDLARFGPWYGNLTSDVDQFIQSIRLIQSYQPSLIISSHKGIVDTDPQAKLERYLTRIYEREERLLHYLSTFRTLNEIAQQRIIYGPHPEPANINLYFERANVYIHLRRLLKLGWIEVKEDTYRCIK
ncbi:MAG: MBL fold metallo-hydrolase [Syntrophomonadaceae bacterium]|nr:MBL fold metallo-hydrolase [Syntrophomonadaceae bacterium]